MNRPFDEAKYQRLLDGLEIAELTLSEVLEDNLSFRCDSEYFKKNYLETIERLKQLNAETLGSLTPNIIHPTEILRIYEESGIQIMLAQNVRDNRFDFSNSAFMNALKRYELANNKIDYDDVVLTRSGANFGQTACFKYNHEMFACADVLVLKKGFLASGYLSTYLNTKYGRGLLDRGSYGMAQPHIAPPYLKTLFIPRFQKIEKIADGLVSQSVDKLGQSKSLYAEAENLLLDELGLHDWQPSEEQIAVKSFKESFLQTGRLDAEYFQAKYQMMLALLGRSGKRICDVADLAKDRFEPSRVDSFEYIEIGNLSGDCSTESETIYAADAPSRAQWIVQTGDVITSTVRPIRRLSALIENDQQGFVCSSGFAVLRPKNIAPELLLVFLRAPIICEILDLHTTASMYPAISTDDLMAIPIPEFSNHLAVAVTEKITQSRLAKQESKHLLDVANRGVEMAIERDEATAMQWMKTQM